MSYEEYLLDTFIKNNLHFLNNNSIYYSAFIDMDNLFFHENTTFIKLKLQKILNNKKDLYENLNSIGFCFIDQNENKYYNEEALNLYLEQACIFNTLIDMRKEKSKGSIL